MTKTIQTQGVTVEVSDPYDEGHSCSAAEAKALNQVRAENVRNNTQKAVMEVLESNGGDVAASQAAVQQIVGEYDAGYEFTLASVGGGGTRLDPLTKECRSIAREYVSLKIKEKGMTQKEYLEKNGDNSIKDLIVKIAEEEQIVKLAKKNLAERSKMDSIDVSI